MPPSATGPLILVIEDDGAVRQTALMLLQIHGFQSIGAEDGPTGIGIYRAHSPQIAAVLTDMRMPGMNGPQVVTELNRIDPDVRIICMTGAMGDFRELQEIPGRLGFLLKPMNSAELVAALRKVMR